MGKNEPTAPEGHNGEIQTIELLKRRWLSKQAFEIELTRPLSFEYKPGQTALIIHEAIQRYYSLVSTPEDPVLRLCVHYVRKGAFSPMLADAEPGTTFKLTGPHGYFTFEPSARQAVFVATGTGIAPFVSMGRSGITDFILLHEVESAEELYYDELFRKISSNYVPCLLKSAADDLPTAGQFHGNAADFIRKNLQPASYDFYLCGERNMTREVTMTVDEIFTGSYVFKEIFY